jgi:hypothetical protein
MSDDPHVRFLKRNPTMEDARKMLDGAKGLPETLRAVDSQLVLKVFGNDPEVRRKVNEFDLPSWSEEQLWARMQAMAAAEMTTDEELDGCGMRLACQARYNPGLLGLGETPAGRVMRTLALVEQLSDPAATAELRRACWAFHSQPRASVKALLRNHPALRERVSRFAPPQPAIVRFTCRVYQGLGRLPRPAKVGGALVGAALLMALVLLLKPSATPAAKPESPADAAPSAGTAPASVSDSFAALLAQPTMTQELTSGPVVVLRDGLDRPLAARLGSLPARVRVVPVCWPVGVHNLPATSDWLTPNLVDELTKLPDCDGGEHLLVVYLEDVGPQKRVVVRRRNGDTIGIAVGRPVPANAAPVSTAVLQAAEAEYRAQAAASQIHLLLSIAQATAAAPLEAYRACAVEAQIAWLTEPNDPATLRLLRHLQLAAVPEVVTRLTDREKEFLHRVRDRAPVGASPAEAVDKEIRLVTPEAKGASK